MGSDRMWLWLKHLLCGDELQRIIGLENVRDSLREEIRKLKNIIAEIQEPPTTPKPIWLDDKDTPYQPKIQFLTQSGGVEEVQMDSKDIYNVSYSLEKLVEQKKWKGLPLDRRFNAIWDYVCRRVKYTFDNKEAWNFPIATYWRKRGDCEDSTILFVTLCRLSDIPSDRVFNALGWFKKGKDEFGHSWAICKMSDDEWYIFETTLIVAGTPKKFKGNNNYFADWGVANWEHFGGIYEGNQV